MRAVRDFTSHAEKLAACRETGFDPEFLPTLIHVATVDLTTTNLVQIMRDIVADPQYADLRRRLTRSRFMAEARRRA